MGAERSPFPLPADVRKRVIEPARERRELVEPSVEIEPNRAWPADRRERPGAGDPDRERRGSGRGPCDRGRDIGDPRLRCRTKEPEGDVKPFEADPAHAAPFGLRGPDGLDEVLDRGARLLAEWDGHEESRLLVQAWRSAPPSRSVVHVARSSVRTRRARSASRHPTTSVSLSSRSLYVLKKCSISTSRWGRTWASSSTWAWCGSPTATHRTLKSSPLSSRISRPPIGRAHTRQPGNVGSSIKSRASVWSPSPARVSVMKP